MPCGKQYVARCGSQLHTGKRGNLPTPLGTGAGPGGGWKKPAVSIAGLARRKRLMRGQSTK